MVMVTMIKQFKDIPHVAIHSIDEELRNGVFYIRTESASSRPAVRAGEMHDLVRRALRNQRDLLGNLLKEVLGDQSSVNEQPLAAPSEKFPLEYNESVEYFSKRLGSGFAADTPVLDIAVMPENESGNITNVALPELRTAAQTALQTVSCTETLLNNADLDASYATNVSLRGISKQRDRFWQMFQNGLMHYRCILPKQIDHHDFSNQIRNFFELVRALYMQKCFNAQALNCLLTIEHSNGMQLITTEKTGTCRIDIIRINAAFTIESLAKDPDLMASTMLNELTVRFNA